MTLVDYKLNCMQNALMWCGDKTSLFLIWNMTFFAFVLRSCKIIKKRFYLFDYGSF